MKVKFYLDKKQQNKDGNMPIRVYVRFYGQTHRINLGRTIHPNDWDAKDGCAREGKKYPLGSLINQVLEKTRSDFRAAELKLEILGEELTFENLLRQCWPDKIREKKTNSDYLISEVIDRIASFRGGRKDSTMVKYATIKGRLNGFKSDLRVSHVKNYGKVLGLTENLRENKGGVFAEYFTRYMQENKYADATIFKDLNLLREVYHEIGLDKGTKYLDYTSRTSEKVSLTADELRRYINTPLDNQAIEDHRKAFIVQTLLGLRDSDYKRLAPFYFDDLEIKGYGVVKVIKGLYMRKTSEPIITPVHPIALAILEEYNYDMPKWVPSGRIWGIRRSFELTGLNRKVTDTSFVGNKIETEVTTLDKLVSSHTARRTCSQLLRKQTGNKDIAQYMLGHREKGSTSIYTHEDPERVIPIILKAWDEILNPAIQVDIN